MPTVSNPSPSRSRVRGSRRITALSALLKKSVSVHEQHTAWYDKKTLFQILLRHNFKEVNFEYIKPRTGARGHLFSNLIYNLKIKILGGVGLFFVVTKVNNPR